MENICCIICGKNNSVPFIKLRDRLANNLESFQLVNCECSFIYLNPRPDSQQISDYYLSYRYDPHNTIIKERWANARRSPHQAIADKMSSFDERPKSLCAHH